MPAFGLPDPSRNLHMPRSHPVSIQAVKACVLPKHALCRGTGLQGDPVTSTTPCKCATKRFMQKYPEIIIDKDGRAWWPVKEPG